MNESGFLDSLASGIGETESLPSNATGIGSTPEGDGEDNDDSDKQSDSTKRKADLIVKAVLLAGCTFWHDKQNDAFVSIFANGYTKHYKVRSRDFRLWVSGLWWRQSQSGVSTAVMEEVVGTLEAQAVHQDGEHDWHVRMAHIEGSLYVDLCDSTWRAVQITSTGWKVVENPPVKFTRTFGIQPLPEPTTGGNTVEKFGKLRRLLNVTDTGWKRLVCWILAAYCRGPYWVLVLTGEQDTAKTTATKLLRQTIDRNEYDVLTRPEEQRDVIFAAVNGYVLALDNLSGIPNWLSDLLCGVSTGTATRMRAYHTNDGTEVGFKARKPCIINGIDLALRDDLGSRALPVELLPIPSENRKGDAEVWAEFDAIHADVLGGIFDILVTVLKDLPSIGTPQIRMVDSGRWIQAAQPAIGWEADEFMRVYEGSRDDTVNITIESDSFATALVELLKDKPDWCGTAKELIAATSGNAEKLPIDFPRTGKAIKDKLKRLSAALRHLGYEWQYRSDGKRRLYQFQSLNNRVGAEVSNVSSVSNSFEDKPFEIDTSKNQSVSNSTKVSKPETPQDDNIYTSDTCDTLTPSIQHRSQHS